MFYKPASRHPALLRVAAAAALICTGVAPALAQTSQKPNIVLIVSDDTGWGDLGVYGGGEGRGAPTPNLDRMAHEGMQFWDFYGQPSCTPGRAAMQTGRLPNRSGMTTVAAPGQGGGLPKGEVTVADVLKNAGYSTFFTGKWHLGEADYAMPTAHGYDEMKSVYLYHLNAYTYADSKWNPDWPVDIQKVKPLGELQGKAGENAQEVRKITSEDIPTLDQGVETASIDYINGHSHDSKPFFMSINFTKNHQPNLPAPEFVGKSAVKTKYGDAVVELDTRIGRVMDAIRAAGIADNTLVFYTVDNGAWQDVYPDAGWTPFRGTKGTDMEAGSRVPAIAWWPKHIKPYGSSWDIAGGLDLMATFAHVAGATLPTTDREGKPTIFDSYDMTPILLGTGKSRRNFWLYQTEDELAPGAIRVGKFKAVFNLRGDYPPFSDEEHTGWRGPDKYVATVPRLYDLQADPGEHYDIFMTSWTEKSWTMPIFDEVLKQSLDSYIKYPPRPVQSVSYTGPVRNSQFQRVEALRQRLESIQKGSAAGD
ncbi:arylsulfatase [Paraburkholderia phenazinium]|jgi:arylsulfatase A-like enzyme|uniref:Arylsulfatase n=1 Tax=Paraburkholderia phenazinium TaxID=60549 RepID=A0A1N6L4R6_9BURK|nr:arylsulfatase [Paraburkholderia phenazinium]SIO63677.1 arylsulfatase [Paraburkholderia phenazinium]